MFKVFFILVLFSITITPIRSIQDEDYFDYPTTSLSSDSGPSTVHPEEKAEISTITESGLKPFNKSADDEEVFTQPEDTETSTANNLDEGIYGASDEDQSEPSDEEESEDSYGLPRHVPDLNHTIQLLTKMAKIVDHSIHTMVSEAVPHVSEFGYRFDISENCIISLLQVLNGFKKQKAWAFRMIDSYGRPSAGFLEGTVTSFGDFDECLRVEFPKYFGETNTMGKYCILQVNFPIPQKPERLRYHEPLVNLSGTDLHETVWSHLAKYINSAYSVKGFRFGVCIPSACSANELEPVIKRIVEPILQMAIDLGPEEECSSLDDWPEATFSSDFALIVFAVVGVLLIVASGCQVDTFTGPFSSTGDSDHEEDEFSEKRSVKGYMNLLLSCFSVQANSKRFLTEPGENRPLRIAYGLMAFSTVGLVVAHTCFFGGFFKSASLINRWAEDLQRNSARFVIQMIFNSHLLTESLFFLSGFIAFTTMYPHMKKSKSPLLVAKLIAAKWLCYSSIVSAITLFYFVFPYIGSGPLFKRAVYKVVDNCEVNWWPNLVAIGNWWPHMEDMCAPQLWFFSADIQLHLLLPLVLYSYRSSSRLGFSVNFLLILIGIASSVMTAVLSGSDLPIGLDHLIDHDALLRQFDVAHFPTHLHLAPFFFGVLLAFLVVKYRETFTLSNKVQSFFWVMSFAVSFGAMFNTYFWENLSSNSFTETFFKILFMQLQRLLWCSFFAWVLLIASVNRSEKVASFIENSYLVFVGKLTSAIYAVHHVPIMMRRFQLKYTIPWDDHFLLSWSSLNVVLSIAAGFLLFAAFQGPAMALGRFVAGLFSIRHQRKFNITNNQGSHAKKMTSFNRSPKNDLPL